ncbi:MAG: phosphopyruvate hydratase [Proteobacteria bacterium]|nr:phosphopyruvate hydratase [Pseudomonadota bacterium]MDB4826654.1 phosphopyruvate hydratase [Gammaproteobacteria bacterium]MBT5625376.1 phosphopyruvate hydratase [Pseudomonadota bacterium]MBT6066115.1 phosphopyruvate hydratase [Pseudomonadota bacterium]MBT6657039.1 phosphopyruvate hydratase [Pseudomonadota bacterium]
MPSNAKISKILAREILDSRGFPTIETEVHLAGGAIGRAAVPSGASTGSREALELRDRDPDRYDGKGVTQAVFNVNTEIASLLRDRDAMAQPDIDSAMIGLDGTPTKERLGANAILSASLAVARAASVAKNIPLFRHISELHDNPNPDRLPVPQMNILNGGAHADNSIDFQEFMVLPVGLSSFSDALRAGVEIFHQLRKVLIQNKSQTGVGDEGGFAPDLPSNEAGLEIILDAISKTGYQLPQDIALGLDLASSEFYQDGKYVLGASNQSYSTIEFIDLIKEWIDRAPIISIEDPLAEDDWEGWAALTKLLGGRVQVTGDDLFVTNSKFLERGIDQGVGNSILVKVNQIGTLSETLATVRLAQANHYGVTVSHRSGETEDTTIADLAVGVGAEQIKTGSLCRSERVAKYNRLLWIERELGDQARYAGLNAFAHLQAS